MFRSIETRRPQIRATNTGISAIITATGEVLASTALGARTTLTGAVVPSRSATTLLVATGEWFGPTALAVGVLLVLGIVIRRGT